MVKELKRQLVNCGLWPLMSPVCGMRVTKISSAQYLEEKHLTAAAVIEQMCFLQKSINYVQLFTKCSEDVTYFTPVDRQ